MNNKILRVFFLGMSLSMVYIVAVTSMASDMFNLSPIVLNEPWFRTTLIDFYFNIAIISAWMIYKEAHLLKSILWVIVFICLGSIGTAFYVFLQFLTLKEGDGFREILLRKDV